MSHRTLRAWWSFGLLPWPDRTGLGPGRGTVTFWPDPKVADQAREVFDMLHKGRRRIGRNDVAVRLRFHGYHVAPAVVRSALLEILGNRIAKMRAPEDDVVDADPIWDRAARWTGQWATQASVPRQIRDDMTDLIGEMIQLVCGEQDDLPVGIADLWRSVTPYVANHSGLDIDDKMDAYGDAEWGMLLYTVRKYLSMPYQMQAVEEASNRDIVAAFRLLWGVAGIWRTWFGNSPGGYSHPGFGRMVDELAPFILATMITVMRESSVHSNWRKFLIDFARQSRQERRLKSC